MITNINIFGERNSGTNFVQKILTHFNKDRIIFWKTKHAFPSYEQLTDCERKKSLCPEGNPNFLQQDTVNVVVSRNILTWCLRMSEKRYHYDENLGKNYNKLELVTKSFISDQERVDNKENSHIPLCQGSKEYFDSFLPFQGIVDMRNKKYKKWIEILSLNNLILLNYDNLISLDQNEFSKLKKLCNLHVTLEQISKLVHPHTTLESHYLNKGLIYKLEKDYLSEILKKIDWNLEKKLGYNLSFLKEIDE